MSEQAPAILLIDDESGIVETVEILLRGEGYEVRTALGGKAGVAALEEKIPDLVITDIRMPGVTGLEILTRAQELIPSCR